jgi:hypothetical protein
MVNGSDQDRLDRATSARLAKLAARPVDISSLQRWLRNAAGPRTVGGSAALRLSWRHWWRPITSSAAAILLVFLIGWFVFGGGSSPAAATPIALAQIHYEIANELSPYLRVSSVDEANQLLSQQASGAVPLPTLPDEVHSCCLHQLAGATLSCVLIERDDQLITITVADGAAVYSPKGKVLKRNGREFISHSANGVNMVMSHVGDRWVCVMGDVSTDVLLEIIGELEL